MSGIAVLHTIMPVSALLGCIFSILLAREFLIVAGHFLTRLPVQLNACLTHGIDPSSFLSTLYEIHLKN